MNAAGGTADSRQLVLKALPQWAHGALEVGPLNTVAGYNLRWAGEIPARTASGKVVRFVSAAESDDGLSYEQRVYQTGVVATRPSNWHDFFNALIWTLFPQAKATINAQHVAEQTAHSKNSNRGRVQDTLTLLDESGVIVASDDASLLGLLREMRWQELFWRRRADVHARMRIVAFGHGLCEQLLTPYVGLTAKALLLEVDASTLAAAESVLLGVLDTKTASWCSERENLLTPTLLCPLPVLGVPGWWPDNEREQFYDNTRYFRSGRARLA